MATDTTSLARRPSLPTGLIPPPGAEPTAGQRAAVWTGLTALSLLAWAGLVAGGFALVG